MLNSFLTKCGFCSQLKGVVSVVVWVSLGVLLALFAVNHILTIRQNTVILEELQAFRSKGPRFTAIDGDSLCRDIQDLQRLAGVNVRGCTFGAGK
jgi:hypothetical protein